MIPKAFKRSLWVFHVNSGSCNGCDIEIIAALTPRYDAERFGIKLVGSPRHADVIAFTGPVTDDMAEKVKTIINQTPEPKVIVIVGSCGISGGVFHESYHLAGPIDKLHPNAKYFYVPGCPPRPEAIIQAFAKAWEWLEEVEKK